MTVPIVTAQPNPPRRAVALTFDDGPSPNTPTILATLAEHGGRVTFFVLGEMMELHPEVAAAAASAGHELANHTWTHPHLGELAEEAVVDELQRTAAAVEQTTGRRPRVIRCPFGEDDARVARLLAEHELGAAVIRWSVDPLDWTNPGPETLVERVLADIHPGAIVVMHDGYGREGTAEAIRTLVPALLADGYELVTVSELLALGESALA